MNEYVDALRSKGWSDDNILKDMEEEVIPFTKTASHWQEWRETLTGWTTDIKKWEKDEVKVSVNDKYTFGKIEIISSGHLNLIRGYIEVIIYLGQTLPLFNRKCFEKEIYGVIRELIENLQQFNIENNDLLDELIDRIYYDSNLPNYFSSIGNGNTSLSQNAQAHICGISEDLIKQLLQNFNRPGASSEIMSLFKEEYEKKLYNSAEDFFSKNND